MTFCKILQFSKKGVSDGVSFGKAVSPHACNCTKKTSLPLFPCEQIKHNFFRFYCLQYLGSTTDKFCFRWNNYKENDRKTLRGQPFEQFNVDNNSCFLNDCSKTLIDKTDGLDPTRRKKYLREVLKTEVLYGLNTLSGSFFTCFIYFSMTGVQIK